jgi:hypothetical protein
MLADPTGHGGDYRATSRAAASGQRVLISDPKTSMLLEERDVLLHRVSWLDAEPPILIGYATHLASDVVQPIP